MYYHFQRAIKSYKFYKGTNGIEVESVKFLSKAPVENILDESNNYNQRLSIWKRITGGFEKFRSRQAKRAFFISFSLLILSGGAWVFPGTFF